MMPETNIIKVILSLDWISILKSKKTKHHWFHYWVEEVLWLFNCWQSRNSQEIPHVAW